MADSLHEKTRQFMEKYIHEHPAAALADVIAKSRKIEGVDESTAQSLYAELTHKPE